MPCNPWRRTIDGSCRSANVRGDEQGRGRRGRRRAQREAERRARHGHRLDAAGRVPGARADAPRGAARFRPGDDVQPRRIRRPADHPSAELPLLHARELLPAREHPAAEHLHPVRHDEQLPGVLRSGTSSGSRSAAASTCRSSASAPTATSPSTSRAARCRSRTRLKTLARPTIDDNARFFKRAEDVPIYAITMGVGTILEARTLVLLANGKNKATAVAADGRRAGHVDDHGQRAAAASIGHRVPRRAAASELQDATIMIG